MTETAEKNGAPGAQPQDALKEAGQQLLNLLVQRAAEAATDRVGGLSDRLTGVVESGGKGVMTAFGRSEERPEGGSAGGVLSRGLSKLKEKAGNVFGGGGSNGQGKKKLKQTNIIEHLDIGLPLRTTYDLWTQFADFPTFMKKVESVEQESDEKTNWKAQVLFSHRTWEATIVEQVPDSHMVWRSKGAKGHVDGAVSFTELGPNLTRVLLVMEYFPQGLFEYTGNIWRAQGRRARLEFKHFSRHALTNVMLHQEEVEGWRGEIRDGEVVKTHEEALKEEEEEEQRAQEPGSEDETGVEDTATDREGVDEDEDEDYDEEDEYADEDEDVDEEGVDEEDVDEEEADEEEADEEEADEEYADDEYADEEQDEDSGRVEESREPVAATRSRRAR